jgi:uncharacterized membrane protein
MLKKKSAPNNSTEANSAGAMLNGRYMAPPADQDGKIWIRTSALVQAAPNVLYQLWRDVESASRWQESIASVTRTGEKTSHWVSKSGDKTIEWDTEILADEPGKRIAWRSTAGDSNNAGEVVFESSPGNRGTMVTVLQEFRMSKWTSLWETVVGRNPKQAIIENLRHFKALAETGEISRTEGQPHGSRGTVGRMKESLYAEKIATPPGELQEKAS